jgi:hypothetical protein
MDQIIRKNMENIRSQDKVLQNQAFSELLEATDQPVDWAYEVWDDLVEGLANKDNHVRAISAQILCNLAKSDPQNRILKDFEKLLGVTKDERFVTARHCLQSLWKIGAVGETQRKIYMEGLERRFYECITEKNCTLMRYDILQSFRNVYDVARDEKIREKALELIAVEENPKYRQKYTSLWRK